MDRRFLFLFMLAVPVLLYGCATSGSGTGAVYSDDPYAGYNSTYPCGYYPCAPGAYGYYSFPYVGPGYLNGGRPFNRNERVEGGKGWEPSGIQRHREALAAGGTQESADSRVAGQ
jgi:hypothetical protein